MAFPFYMKVTGTRQGDFKGDSSNPRRVGWIKCLDFQLQFESPRDQASGQASGKRIWKPIVITKQWDAASPQFLQALATNLTDASVTEVRQYIGRHGEAVDLIELEQVGFTFRRIDVEFKIGGTIFSDTWLL